MHCTTTAPVARRPAVTRGSHAPAHRTTQRTVMCVPRTTHEALRLLVRDRRARARAATSLEAPAAASPDVADKRAYTGRLSLKTAGATTVRQLGDNVWLLHQQILDPIPIPLLDLTMVVVRLKTGGLWVASPIPLTGEVRDTLAALGRVEHVLLPSTIVDHWTFVVDYVAEFGEAQFWAGPVVASGDPRFQDVRLWDLMQGVQLRVLDPSDPPSWHDEVEFVHQTIDLFQETTFFIKSINAITLWDSAMGVSTEERAQPLSWPVRLGFQSANMFQRLTCLWYWGVPLQTDAQRAATREWAARVRAWPFHTLLCAHFDHVVGDGKRQFERTFGFLL